MNVLVTAGPTQEKIDPVRYITNHSTGKMGYAIATNAMLRGANVTLVSGPTNIKKPPFVEVVDIKSAQDMFEAVTSRADKQDVIIKSAAVADYAPATCSESKIKREKTDSMTIELVKNPDIAATLGKMKSDSQMLVGFALETDNEKENAIRKINNKNLDWIVLNSLKDKEAGFQKDTNKITMLSRIGQEIPFDAKLKTEVAKDIIDTIICK